MSFEFKTNEVLLSLRLQIEFGVLYIYNVIKVLSLDMFQSWENMSTKNKEKKKKSRTKKAVFMDVSFKMEMGNPVEISHL